MIMAVSKIMVKAFFNDQVDTHRKVICVFDENVTEEDMRNIIREHLREEEYDDIDDSAPLHTAEEIEDEVDRIMNGGLSDFDMDRYFIDDVEMYVQK
jgi:predicted Rossmann-fold nucleotide-binding protein